MSGERFLSGIEVISCGKIILMCDLNETFDNKIDNKQIVLRILMK